MKTLWEIYRDFIAILFLIFVLLFFIVGGTISFHINFENIPAFFKAIKNYFK